MVEEGVVGGCGEVAACELNFEDRVLAIPCDINQTG